MREKDHKIRRHLYKETLKDIFGVIIIGALTYWTWVFLNYYYFDNNYAVSNQIWGFQRWYEGFKVRDLSFIEVLFSAFFLMTPMALYVYKILQKMEGKVYDYYNESMEE